MASNGPVSMGRLKYAEKDAEDFGKVLQSYRYGFEIINPKKGSRPYEILELLSVTVFTCERDDDLVCYFSGHGDLINGKLHLVLSDESKTDPQFLSLDVEDIQRLIKRCRSKNKLLILDCCHAGGSVDTKSGDNSEKRLQDISSLKDNDNYIVLVASERLSKIREYSDLKGSFLTRKICEGLDKEFSMVDIDLDQRISISDIMLYLQKTRSDYNLGKIDDKKVPLPYIFGQQKGSPFYLTQDKHKWSPFELSIQDGIVLVILPLLPHNGNCLFMFKYCLTNAQYKTFVKEEGVKDPEGRHLIGKNSNGELEWKENFEPWKDERFNHDDQPVVCVSYNDALTYCKWLERKSKTPLTSLPQSLITSVFIPSVKSWNIAAYGKLNSIENYGNQSEWLNQAKAVHHNSSQPLSVYEDGSRTNSRGISDMFGNVWQWCAGEIVSSMSINRQFRGNPILKGGGFLDDLSSQNFTPVLDSYQVTAGRITPSDFRSFDLGVRVAGMISISALPEEVRLKLSLCPSISEHFWYDIDNYKLLN